MKKWEKLLNRGGKFKMTMSTKVCSNHFAAGYCSDLCRIPTLFLKGYENTLPNDKSAFRCSRKRQNSDGSSAFSPLNKRSRNITRNGFDSDDVMNSVIITPPAVLEHCYEINPNHVSSRTVPVNTKVKYNSLIIELQTQIKEKDDQLKNLKKKLNTEESKRFCYSQIKNDEKCVRFYTGCQNSGIFDWIVSKIKGKALKLHYFRGENSFATKNYQHSQNHRKGGKKMVLDIEDLLLLTLMRLRVGTPEFDLAFRFQVSQSLISRILATWIPFLAKELESLIYWPSREDIKRYYPKCFKKYDNVVGIIDCTEGVIEKPSIAKAQSQTYSTYKSRNTWKKLICITPAGTISFISKSYGGAASDRFITENCGLLDKLNEGDNIMADKGFNISDLLICKQSKLIIPPFLREKGKFSQRNCTITSNIAKARIHVERAIARIKDFRLLQGAFPLTLKDQLDNIFIICSAITNLAPALVPL